MIGAFILTSYALLCGSAPKGFRQRKIEYKYDFLTSEAGGKFQPGSIVVFPNGVDELFLESLLNETLEKASDAEDDGATGEAGLLNADDYTAGQVLLYLCARSQANLCAELSDCAVPGVEVVRLGEDEVRKEVIAYYADLAEKMGVDFRVEYDWDGELIAEESLGWEKVI